MKRAVVDNNIFISSVFWKGVPGQVIQLFAEQKATLVLSNHILKELAHKLNDKKFAPNLIQTGKSVEQIIDDLVNLAEIVTPLEVPQDAVRDKKDRIILACAIGRNVDYIVSDDKDLIILNTFQQIPILKPAQFLALFIAPDPPDTTPS